MSGISETPIHQPVLLREMLQNLKPNKGDILVDATLGLGGAASLLAREIGTNGIFIGLDKDEESLKIAERNLSPISLEKFFIHTDFSCLKSVLKQIGHPQVDVLYLDLGISNYQLSHQQRGFSFKTPAPLDMRINQKDKLMAADILNHYDEKDLANLIFRYGQERYSRRIARKIVEYREKKKIKSTDQLVDIIENAIRRTGYRKRTKIHPATRTFQSLRIAVNNELESLELLLKQIPDCLKPGGRIGIISFHSLEDQLVKKYFRKFAGYCICQKKPELCQCPKIKILDIVTKKPVIAKEDEIQINPKSRSAKFRVAVKL